MDWVYFLEQEEWHQKTRTDYYLAQIACEIRRFAEGFSERPNPVTPEDFIIRFTTDEAAPPDGGPTPPVTHRKKRKPIDVGVDELDDEWKRVADSAKSQWAGFLGVAALDEVRG